MPQINPSRTHSSRLLAWLGLCALIILLDQASKWLILAKFSPGEAMPLSSFFRLVLVFNTGAAFSFLASQPGWQRWFLSILSLLITAWLINMLRQCQHERLMPFSLSLIIGGAIGNVIDRIVHGKVVDFLYFHIDRYGFPAFNIADSAITVGVILMLCCQFLGSKPPPAESSS